jgi:hypothetical protein
MHALLIRVVELRGLTGVKTHTFKTEYSPGPNLNVEKSKVSKVGIKICSSDAMGNVVPKVAPPPAVVTSNFPPEGYYGPGMRGNLYLYYYQDEAGFYEAWRAAMMFLAVLKLGFSTYIYMLVEHSEMTPYTRAQREHEKEMHLSSRRFCCELSCPFLSTRIHIFVLSVPQREYHGCVRSF